MNNPKHVTLDCGILRIEFQRLQDRWQHIIGIARKDHFSALATSIEGVADDLWPTSPTLQELHVEQRGEDCAAMLMGMAGSSHWSASILCQPSVHRAVFDIACRCREAPAWLGSLYQTPEWLNLVHSDQRVELQIPHDPSRIVARCSDLVGSVPQFDAENDNAWTAAFVHLVKGLRRTIFFSPRHSVEDEPQTVRWTYTFEAVP